jgi:hypothetical protein
MARTVIIQHISLQLHDVLLCADKGWHDRDHIYALFRGVWSKYEGVVLGKGRINQVRLKNEEEYKGEKLGTEERMREYAQ